MGTDTASSVRTRSTILRPSASRTDAFRPVPPMSIASVVGVDRASSGTGIIVVSSVRAIATSLQTCSMDRSPRRFNLLACPYLNPPELDSTQDCRSAMCRSRHTTPAQDDHEFRLGPDG